jgi:hypothetical protein
MHDGKHPSPLAVRLQAAGLCVPFVLSLFVQLTGRAPGPMAAPPIRPALAFDQYLIDLGPVEPSEQVAVPFRFTNRGKSRVTINELLPSCGCLQPELKQKVFAPGKSGSFKLRVQTANQLPGPKEYQVTVKYSDPQPREASVVFRVVLPLNQVFVRPPALAFSTYAGAPPTQQEVSILDGRARHLKITRVDCYRNLAFVEQLEGELAETGHWRGRLNVSVAANLPSGRHETMIRIFTDDPDYRMLRVPLVIDVRGTSTIVDPQVRTTGGTR